MVSHGGRGEISNNSGDRQVGVLKKGPWTAAEDAVLLEYVKRQGEGNWNAVQKNSGLQRCGKSCRLRWANHLRPFLKKGPFTPDEEKTILDLHSKIGNKWARMAAQLPGRTDNEIKNYWNTRLKRRQRANLPIYPVDLLQHQYNHNHNHNQQQPPISQVYPSSSFTSIISATGAASSSNNQTHLRRGQNQNFIPLDLLNHGNNIMSPTNSFSYLPRVNNNNGLISNHAFSFQNLPLYQKPLSFDFGIGLNTGAEPISTTTTTTNNNNNNNNNTRTTSFGQLGLFSMATGNTELSSIQNRTPIMTVQTSNSGYTGSDELMGGVSSGGDDEYDIKKIERCNSGLLGDLLEESQAIKRGDNNSREKESFEDYKTPLIKPKLELFGGVSLSAHSNNEVKEKTEEVGEEMNIMDDDLLRLLECPSPVCIPDWYEIGSSTNTSNYNSSTEPSNVTTTTDMIRNPKKEEDDGDDWDENFCCWNNMPRVLS